MRRRIAAVCVGIIQWLRPKPDLKPIVRFLEEQLKDLQRFVRDANSEYMERVAELQEARQMQGSGPWTIGPGALESTDAVLEAAYECQRTGLSLKETLSTLKETMPVGAIGAVGDIELALQNVEWKRETNLALLEFSRWGIQQIILISRLYYVKNPLIRRGCNVCSAYVFGRGVEVSSDNSAADDVIKQFFDDNSKVLGQVALAELEKRKWYDGNLFFVFFVDTQATGGVKVRTIDATEVMEIICNPNDGEEPWFYRRKWAQSVTDIQTGIMKMISEEAYYPVIGWEDLEDFPPMPAGMTIGKIPVMVNNPVLHRKTGGVAKWHFGCPPIYPALDWAKTSRRLLEASFTVAQSLAQISMTLTTKGGQQALAGAKQQLATTVGPTSSLWDTNPTAVNASIFASGPGTTLEAFKTTGAGIDPERVKRFIHWVAMVFGVPETFFADASVGSLATATSLDRPTELNFLERQEAWREDLTTIAKFVLTASKKATSGKLREAGLAEAQILAMKRELNKRGQLVYVYEAAANPTKKQIKVKVSFPAIREGDMPQIINAIVQAMSLGNRGGQIVGIDEKEGIKLLFEQLGVDNYQDIVDKMYPAKEYDIDRTTAPIPAPVPTAPPINPGGLPQPQPAAVFQTPAKPAGPGSAAPGPVAGNKTAPAASQNKEGKRPSKNWTGVLLERLRKAVKNAKLTERRK
ncbi:MAG: hypothetical protein WA618_12905 [Terriglobales bacterium]